MRLSRLVRTSSFRLTLLYAALFSASVLVLFGVIYWVTAFYMTGQIDATIDSDITELQEGLRRGAPKGIAELIAERVAQMPSGPIFYLLQDPAGHVLAGNLPPVPATAGAIDLDPALLRPHDGDIRAIHARGLVLPGGDYLLVGADAYPLQEMRKTILRAFAWSLAITLLLAAGGGALMSGSVLRRVESISRTARDIMSGNLSRRIPTGGANDEFDHLADSLNAMLDRTESSIEAIRQVSNDIAHDLRTPLTRLRQRLELAQRKARSGDELRAAIESSLADVDAILETFGALLRIAQVESGAPREHFTRVELSDLLHTVAEVYRPLADDRRQSLALEVAPRIAVRGDRELLAQMLANLLENALRHAPEGASVTLTATRSAGDVAVEIADDGPGIPPAERARVFRRFYRLEASRTTPGTGLGLSLVAAVAALHGIAIDMADNEPGLRVRLRFRGGGLPETAGAAPAA